MSDVADCDTQLPLAKKHCVSPTQFSISGKEIFSYPKVSAIAPFRRKVNFIVTNQEVALVNDSDQKISACIPWEQIQRVIFIVIPEKSTKQFMVLFLGNECSEASSPYGKLECIILAVVLPEKLLNAFSDKKIEEFANLALPGTI
jgi:hypothetical protein